jgi:hypothetical protein
VKAVDRPIFKEANRGSSTSVHVTGADLMISTNPAAPHRSPALADQGNALQVAHIAAPIRSFMVRIVQSRRDPPAVPGPQVTVPSDVA